MNAHQILHPIDLLYRLCFAAFVCRAYEILYSGKSIRQELRLRNYDILSCQPSIDKLTRLSRLAVALTGFCH